MSLPPLERLPLRVRIGHGFGSVAYGVKDNGFSTLLLIFYNQVMGLDPWLVGLILLGALLFDAMIDPLVGYFSDKTYTRWGKRHPWMYAAIVPMALFWTLLWFPPALSHAMLYGYLFVCAFLMRASVSLYEVPALAVVPALSTDYDERTSITRWRLLFAWTGGLTMLILAFGVFLVPALGHPIGLLNQDGYHRYGLFGAALIIVATLVSTLTTHRRLAHFPDEAPTHLPPRETIRRIFVALSHRAYLLILGSTFFAYAATGVAFSATTYMMSYVWEMPQSGFLAYSITLFGGVVGAFLLVGSLQARIEKTIGTVVLGLLGVSIAVLPYVLKLLGLFPQNGSPALIPTLFSIVTLANAFSVGSVMLGQSMVADVVEASQEKTGERNEGIFFAGYFFAQKSATGFGIFLTALILSGIGFPKGAKPGAVALPILDHLILIYVIVLLALGWSSAALIARFPITRAEHSARVRQLALQKAS
jgi:glycoside/pentoside/hexuronide:cation symporter, GPH family